MGRIDNLINKQEKIDELVNYIDDDNIKAKNLLVKDRIMNPAYYIVMLGETSSGKSSLVNTIFNEKILIEKASPSTGSIVEMVVEDRSDEVFFAINKDSSIEELDKKTFDALMVEPDEELNRLRYIGKSKNGKYEGMRIFDTPGYGSLISHHEDVLKDFIPNSDFIVYTVSYKSGLGEADYQFLKFVSEIIHEKTEVVLAINMCPETIGNNDKRIVNISDAVNECMHRNVKRFFIYSSKEKKPNASQLWDYIIEEVNKEEKLNELYEILGNCQNYILDECKINIMKKIAECEESEEEKLEKKQTYINTLKKEDEIVKLIEDRFYTINNKCMDMVMDSTKNIINKVDAYINNENKWTRKEESFSYIQNYYVTNLISEETDIITNYIEDEIISLDNDIENLLNTAIKDFTREVSIHIPIYAEVIENIIEKYIGNGIKNSVTEVFLKYGGRGKVGAGVANAACKGLKNIGSLFGQKFSKETYNNLKHGLKVIKATSVKGITTYLSIFTEGLLYVFDSLTWQTKLKEWVKKSLNKWEEDTKSSIAKELNELKEINIDEIIQLFEELKSTVTDEEENKNDRDINELMAMKEKILELYNF